MMSNTVKFYQDKALEWRWRIIADNGNILADSSEGYKNRIDCENSYQSMQDTL
jgi:uncharacterized protein YegP (UPF0339 family)